MRKKLRILSEHAQTYQGIVTERSREFTALRSFEAEAL
jgi:hypothetical protein